MSILFPILPFLVERFHSDAFTLGLLTSCFAIAQFLATPAIGALSDRYGRRPVMLICVLGSAIAYFMFGWAAALWVLFLSRIIDGMTGGVAATAQAYIADTSKPGERSKNFGLTGVAFGLGFVLGPALGGALSGIDITFPVFFAGSLALCNAILGYFTLPESLSIEKRRSIHLTDLNPMNQVSDLFRNRRIRGFLWATFIFNFAFTGFTSIFVLFLHERLGWGPTAAATIFVFIGVVSTIVQGGLIRKLLPIYGEAKLTVIGFVTLAVGLALVSWLPNHSSWLYPLLYTSQALLALGVGLLLPCLRGLISNRVSDREQGRTIANAQGIQSIAAILGPLWAGWTFDHLSLSAPFWLGSLLVLLGLIFVLINLRQPQSQMTLL
jgi:multidrug resistance protein